MEDYSPSTDTEFGSRIQLGMVAFDIEERQQFGQNVRLAMKCIEGAPAPANIKTMPSDEGSIRHCLKVLSQDITSGHADLLELLFRYDDMEGWTSSGC